MKRFKILILAIATVGLFGCENYLSQEPQDAFPDSPAFWSNETVLELETNYFRTTIAVATLSFQLLFRPRMAYGQVLIRRFVVRTSS